ncbi:uncharacterized protein LOC110682635 [Chenopodium quinoa]|uniref:uncharacterized protein LOC110682635 n=1 Tax=Chenopodium quinoa TaxID=63459 RepID=UPI000B7997B9|nr:uncharacterized protein LOC110682635 [Chenopodium quinoa]
MVDSVDTIRDHVVCHGFRPQYHVWVWHGEKGSYRENVVGNDTHDNSAEIRAEDEYGFDYGGDGDDDGGEGDEIEDGGGDHLDEMMHNVEGEFGDRCDVFESLSEAAKKPLYPGSKKYTKLLAVLTLFNIKSKYNWSDTKLEECPRCGKSRYKRKSCNAGMKGPPAKVLWYLPIIPRFKRLFSISKDVKNLRWHAEGRKKNGLLKHPADSPDWKNIDMKFRAFGDEVRNLRLGLCTDVIYNLPPWLCMKRKYVMLSLLITGPRQPGNDIDVYLEPLVDDLRKMWDEGVSVFDAHKNEMFLLRAVLMWTINDFPAYGNLSGYKNKGHKACPICIDDTPNVYLEHYGKDVYVRTRRLLRRDHPYRRQKKAFNGKVEEGAAPKPLSGHEVYSRVKGISTVFEKNVCDAVVGTIMGIHGKTKDGKSARLDLEAWGVRPELWVQPKVVKAKVMENENEYGGKRRTGERKGKGTSVSNNKDAGKGKNEKVYLPPACYTLSKEEKRKFCACLYNIKVPSGFSSNMKRFVSLNGEMKLTSMKSHDCHMMMQVFLPIAIRGILPKHVREAITSLCSFFNTICSKVLDPFTLDALQANMCGPVFMRWCYPFERHMGTLQHKVRNPAHPEGSMIQGIVAEEIGNFVAEYVAVAEPIGLPTSRHEGRLDGHGTLGQKRISPTHDQFLQDHLFVLHHVAEVHPYLEEHMDSLRAEFPSKGERALMQLHNKMFVMWFHDRVMRQLDESVSDTIKWLAYGPKEDVYSFEGYDINGYTFWTEHRDQKSSSTQNSGVTLVASSREFASARDTSPVDAQLSYYGRIQEIWELDYREFKVGLFKCKWVDNIRRNVKHDDFTLVDLGHLRDSLEPFILASQAKQVFYVTDPADPRWSIVLASKRRILGVGDVEDEDEYDAFDDSPPFTAPTLDVTNDVEKDTNYIRSDHNEGILE